MLRHLDPQHLSCLELGPPHFSDQSYALWASGLPPAKSSATPRMHQNSPFELKNPLKNSGEGSQPPSHNHPQLGGDILSHTPPSRHLWRLNPRAYDARLDLRRRRSTSAPTVPQSHGHSGSCHGSYWVLATPLTLPPTRPPKWVC